MRQLSEDNAALRGSHATIAALQAENRDLQAQLERRQEVGLVPCTRCNLQIH